MGQLMQGYNDDKILLNIDFHQVDFVYYDDINHWTLLLGIFIYIYV